MTTWTDNWETQHGAIIAGATGLVGRHLLEHLLRHDQISAVYSLARTPVAPEHDPDLKLVHFTSDTLTLPSWPTERPKPTLGYICLGTTKKQAGSRQALEQVDLTLVCQVAKAMQELGVKRIAVVSSFGACPRSLSHYLRCKGKMESAITAMSLNAINASTDASENRIGFEQVVFAQPGPLQGKRAAPRWDEHAVQGVLKVIRPLMLGPLDNLVPIDADCVAQSMLNRTLAAEYQPIERLKRRDMLR